MIQGDQGNRFFVVLTLIIRKKCFTANIVQVLRILLIYHILLFETFGGFINNKKIPLLPHFNKYAYVYTGSAVRNWYKVKTWLNQMIWQIYQKLMLSGFLSSGILCLIHYLKLFWPHAASTASIRKDTILGKNWILDDPFHKNLPVLVILVPGMIRPSRSGSFLGEIGL